MTRRQRTTKVSIGRERGEARYWRSNSFSPGFQIQAPTTRIRMFLKTAFCSPFQPSVHTTLAFFGHSNLTFWKTSPLKEESCMRRPALILVRFSPVDYGQPLTEAVICPYSGCPFSTGDGEAMKRHQQENRHPGWGALRRQIRGKDVDLP